MTDEEAKAQAEAMHRAAFEHRANRIVEAGVSAGRLRCACGIEFDSADSHLDHRRHEMTVAGEAAAPAGSTAPPTPERHLDRSEAERAEDIRAVTKVAWQWFLGFREVGFGYESSLRLVMSMLRDDGPM